MLDRDEALEGHTTAQQLRFYKDASGWPLMQYKHLCTDSKWPPIHGGGIKLWMELPHSGLKVPFGWSTTLVPNDMGPNIDKIRIGISAFVDMWSLCRMLIHQAIIADNMNDISTTRGLLEHHWTYLFLHLHLFGVDSGQPLGTCIARRICFKKMEFCEKNSHPILHL